MIIINMNKIMENNEQIEDSQIEDNQDTASSAEQTEENTNGQEETVESLKAQVAKYKAISERKDKKLQAKEDVKSTTLKINTEQNAPTIEHMAILSRDSNVEKLKFAEKLAKVEGITLTEAYEGEIAQAKFIQMDNEAQIKTNSIGASTGGAPAPRAKTVGNMTDDEHRDLWNEKTKNAING